MESSIVTGSLHLQRNWEIKETLQAATFPCLCCNCFISRCDVHLVYIKLLFISKSILTSMGTRDWGPGALQVWVWLCVNEHCLSLWGFATVLLLTGLLLGNAYVLKWFILDFSISVGCWYIEKYMVLDGVHSSKLLRVCRSPSAVSYGIPLFSAPLLDSPHFSFCQEFTKPVFYVQDGYLFYTEGFVLTILVYSLHLKSWNAGRCQVLLLEYCSI